MKLLVISYKSAWPSSASPSGYATDGGFPIQMRALSELFDATTLLIPCGPPRSKAGEGPLSGHNLSIEPLTIPTGKDLQRKLIFPFWLARNIIPLTREVLRADAIHAPIPGDIGTIGMLLAYVFKKPLFVRYCGNWMVQATTAEKFWRWFMESVAGGRNVCLATGSLDEPPSQRNRQMQWIFATSLTEQELRDCATVRQGFNPAAPRLVIACRQEKEKGTGVVIEAMKLLEHDLPGLQFDIVGDGGARKSFQQQAAALGLEDRIHFHGQVGHDRVIQLLKGADLFCFPTTSSEGFPKAALEAMACGLPVVSTKVSALPQLVGSGAGILLEEATPAETAEAIRRCLSDAGQYQVMSRRAVQTARDYSLERWRDRIGELLNAAWGPLRRDD